MSEREIQRYPLAWPPGWRRTPAAERQRAQFGTVQRQAGGIYGGKRRLTVAEACDRLEDELRRLGADREVLSTNIRLRLDGAPRSDQGEPPDTGAAVYFRLHGRPICLAADRWDRVADNIAALAHHIEALRAIERYGVGTTDQAFAGYAALEPDPARDWWIPLEVAPTATLVEIEEAFRRLAKAAHPDVGGSHDRMARLTAARAAARKALGETA